MQTTSLRFLIGYYGVVQILHLWSLVRAGMIYASAHRIGFPAPPPPGGWSEQAMNLLLALGITDALLIILSLIFVCGFFAGKPWMALTGLLASGGALVTALVFALGTLPAGAWQAHPYAYGLITVLFLPFILLFAQLLQLILQNSTQKTEV